MSSEHWAQQTQMCTHNKKCRTRSGQSRNATLDDFHFDGIKRLNMYVAKWLGPLARFKCWQPVEQEQEEWRCGGNGTFSTCDLIAIIIITPPTISLSMCTHYTFRLLPFGRCCYTMSNHILLSTPSCLVRGLLNSSSEWNCLLNRAWFWVRSQLDLLLRY